MEEPVSPELNQLIELQELDLEIQRISERLARIPSEREQTENEFKQDAAEFLDLKSKYEQTRLDRIQLENDLATTQQNHEKFERDKTRVTNEREYAAVLREIDTSRKHISALETEILKQMEETEKLEVAIREREPDVERKRAAVDDGLTALDREHESGMHQLVELETRRNQLSIKLSKSLFATYDRMARTRRGQALAEVRHDGICSACRMKVRPKIFSDVRKGDQMITCENCGRILYYRDRSSQSAEAAIQD